MTDNLQTGIENTQPTQDNLNQIMPTVQEPTITAQIPSTVFRIRPLLQ